jgi:hypothetical protein
MTPCHFLKYKNKIFKKILDEKVTITSPEKRFMMPHGKTSLNSVKGRLHFSDTTERFDMDDELPSW